LHGKKRGFMPKLKTNRAAAKRFKLTGKGHLKHRSSFRNHILTKKNSKRKAQLAGTRLVHERDEQAIKKLLN